MTLCMKNVCPFHIHVHISACYGWQGAVHALLLEGQSVMTVVSRPDHAHLYMHVFGIILPLPALNYTILF